MEQHQQISKEQAEKLKDEGNAFFKRMSRPAIIHDN